MSDPLKWNLKDGHGRIFGPLETQKIIELIEKGVLTGGELISRQGEERWTAISKYPEFYDVIVESLNQPQTQFSPDDFANEISKVLAEPKPVVVQKPEVKKRGRVVVEEDKAPTVVPPPVNTRPPEPEKTRVFTAPKSTIDLSDLSSQSDTKNKKIFFFIIGIVAVFLTLFLLEEFQRPNIPMNGSIQLLFPSQVGESLSPEEQRKILQQALRSFEKDSYADYYQAQVFLVRLLESNKKNLDALSLLCMTYRELWSFANKDSRDLQSLTKLVQMAQNENSMGVHGTTCRLVQVMIVGDVRAQESALQSAMSEFPTGASFYEMKAENLKQQKKESIAIAFLQKAQSLWPNWIKPYFKEAQYRSDIGDGAGAEVVLKNILNKNPQSQKALILLGILEISSFNKSTGVDKILIGLKEESVPQDLKASAYTALANYHIANDSKKALEYAKQSYAINPYNDSMRVLIIQLGGEGELATVKSEDSQLLLAGDSYLKNKNYLAAQAQFKAAYDLNPKNATAALKAAESLWKLNQSEEAISWAQKAVRADPKYLEAYYLLSDYYTQKFDFKSAADALAQAKGKTRANYQLLRSYAQLELRRKNNKSAKQFAEQALKLYDSDSTSLNIMAEALRREGDYENSFRFAAKSVQLDSQNASSHEAYALAVLGYKGLPAATTYLNNLINTYPDNIDYKLSYSEVLFQDERYSDAIDSLDNVVRADPSKYRAWMLLGDSYTKTNQLNEALKSYFKAASLDPSNSEPIFNIGQVYMKSKPNLSKAFKQFQRVIQTNPRYPLAHYNAGQAAYEMNMLPQAQEYAEKEKKLNPNLADPYILSAEIAARQENYSKAAAELGRAVKLRPKDSNLYILLARNHRLSGQLDAASSMLRVAQGIESGNADIYKEQGAVFEKMGLSEQAQAAYSRYIEIKPNADDRSDVEARMRALGGG